MMKEIVRVEFIFIVAYVTLVSLIIHQSIYYSNAIKLNSTEPDLRNENIFQNTNMTWHPHQNDGKDLDSFDTTIVLQYDTTLLETFER